MKNIGLYFYILILIFAASGLEAKSRCGRGIARLAHRFSHPIHPILFETQSLEELGSKKFFKNSKAKLFDLEFYILSQIPSSLPEDFQKNLLMAMHHYQARHSELLPIFNPARAEEIYGDKNPSLKQVLNYFQNSIQNLRPQIQAYLDRLPRQRLREPFRTIVTYRWIILGTTIFTLWNPIQAEISSLVYGGFNWARGIFSTAALPNERIAELDRIQAKIKNELRNLYFISSEDYPSTTMMSRNNISYLQDLVNKRRDELAAAHQRQDEAAVEHIMMQLYLVPFMYQDILREPIGGFVIKVLNESYQKFDPDGVYWKKFQEQLDSLLSKNGPGIWRFDELGQP